MSFEVVGRSEGLAAGSEMGKRAFAGKSWFVRLALDARQQSHGPHIFVYPALESHMQQAYLLVLTTHYNVHLLMLLSISGSDEA